MGSNDESQLPKKHHRVKVPDDIEVAIPPDGGYGWIVLIACFFVSFIIDGCMYSFGILLNDIREYYGVDQERANLISSLNTGFLFLSGPAVAGFANKFGCRAVIMVSSIICSSMYVLCTFSPNIYWMYISYGFLGGITMGSTYIPSLIVVAMYFEKKRGIATGICMAGSGVGAFVFAPFTQYLLKTFDWKMTNIILGAIVLQCCVLGALMRPIKPTKMSQVELDIMLKKNVKDMKSSKASLTGHTKEEDFQRPLYKEDVFYTGSVTNLAEYQNAKDERDYVRSHISIPSDDGQKESSFGKVFMDILKEMSDFKLLRTNKQFLMIVLANFFVFIGYFSPFIYLPIRGKELKLSNPAFLISIIGIVNIPARMLFGAIADRKWISAFNLNTFSFILCAGINLVYFSLNNEWLQITYSVVFAIGTAGMNSLTSVYLCEMVGLENLTNSTGIISMFRGLGCFLGPFLAGVIANKMGSSVSAFIFSGIMFSIGVALVFLITIVKLIRGCLGKGSKSNNETRLPKDETANKTLLSQS